MVFELNLKSCLIQALKTARIIILVVIPYYLLAETLLYFDLMQHVAFIFTPISTILNLPAEAALVIAAGVFLNVYAAIAFAAPLELTVYDWTVLGLFLGVLHSIPVESTILKSIGISWRFSVTLRTSMAFVIVLPLFLLPDSWFFADPDLIKTGFHYVTPVPNHGFWLFFAYKAFDALILAIQIIILVSAIIVFNEIVKNLKILQKFNHHLTLIVSLITGFFIGITYGAGILIKESKNLNRQQVMAVCCFLMVCHAIIEDTLLFVIFGANIYVLVIFRLILSTIIFFLVYFWYARKG